MLVFRCSFAFRIRIFGNAFHCAFVHFRITAGLNDIHAVNIAGRSCENIHQNGFNAAVLRFHGFQGFGISCLCGTEYSGKQQGLGEEFSRFHVLVLIRVVVRLNISDGLIHRYLKFKIGQPFALASFSSSASGLTATGSSTIRSNGKSFLESL